ncbi:PREDICTED: DNA-directed RNA polymerase III subunit RPC4-like [Cyprinodon variegatus]|uniref:DNA-directed RNA polymerase III subunit RPC4-like n=1 Tax=Cyprinodon variegatus TaxID=28743 RepID=A0A3Q2CPN2_CYPVA|nr:PREDICTED: DNA-directed RNA polymerase III subunit RPC4-like [Cyprinodon variegatus]
MSETERPAGPERSGAPEHSRTWSLGSGGPRGRLPSLRTRDLTLGGAPRKAKKTWEPNVHAVRRSREELRAQFPVAPKKEKTERSWKRRESRGGRRSRPQTIQSHSIFEHHPASSSFKTGRSGTRSFQNSSSSPGRLVKKEGEASWEDEGRLLSRLQRDDFLVDPELRNDSSLQPVSLPQYRPSSISTSTASGPEPAPSRGAELRTAPSEPPEQPSLVKKLQDLSVAEGEQMFFMQFPDGLPAAEEAAHGGRSEKEGKLLQLHQLPEGFLGKLQIRKSGKVELKLGDVLLDVSEGAAFSFLQQLVSVRLTAGRTGNLVVLGNVQHKLVLSPDFQSLLDQAAAAQP